MVAHIRHVYTDYDRLLKITSFQEARAAVEEPCLAKLVQWRGDDENGTTVLEDVFREVVVISDDEDDNNPGPSHGGRTRSAEIVSNNTIIGNCQTNPMSYETSIVDPSAICGSAEDEPPAGFRYVPLSPRKRSTTNKTKIDRGASSRYQAWDRARHRYRNATGKSNHIHGLDEPAEQYYHHDRVANPLPRPSDAGNPRLTEIPNHKLMVAVHPEDPGKERYREPHPTNYPPTRFTDCNERNLMVRYLSGQQHFA